MNNEELLAKYKALFPDNVEAIVVRKDDYDRLYGDLTKENIELKEEIERLNNIINKAIEYIEDMQKHPSYCDTWSTTAPHDIICILKGSDKK